MAENWFQKMYTVQKKIQDYERVGLIKSEPELEDVLASRLEQLKALRANILVKEENFFGSLSTTAPFKDDPKRAMSVLNKKVQEWNESGARYMIANDSIKTTLEILTSGDYRGLPYKELEGIAEDFINSDGQYIIEEQANTVMENLLSELDEVLGQGQKLTRHSRQGDAYVYFTLSRSGNKWKVDLNTNLKPELKSKFKRAMKKILEQRGQSTHAFSDSTRNAELVQKVILSKITNSQVQNTIKQELSIGKIEKFNLAKDFNVIKGFLGEVYWSAFFSFLGAKTEPTGDIKDDVSGASIGVDLLVNNYGFQVKNFNSKPDGKISFGTRGGYKSAGTFIRDRAAIEEKLCNLLLDLYGSYAYNIDVSDGTFTDTRTALESLLTTDVEEVFEHYIDKIIRLDAEQQNEMMRETDGFIPDQRLMVNTFFVIGDKIIPSSAILTEIIDSIGNASSKSAIDFAITGIKAKEDSPKYDEKINWVSYKMANYTGISYSIDLDIQNILEKAYQNAWK